MSFLSETMMRLPSVSYEFPNGFNTDFDSERFKIPEALFNPSILKVNIINFDGYATLPNYC